MLFKATVTKFQSIKATGLVRGSSGTSMVLNTNRVSKLQTRASTKSKFRYTFNLWDRREKYSYVETDSSAATIVTAFDASWDSNAVAVNYYPGANTSNTVETIYLNNETIALAIADATASSSRSWLWYYDGAGKENKILIAHELDHLIDIATTGTTSTF